MINGYQGQFNPSLVATVAISTQLSAALATGGFSLCGIILPAALTSTAMTFTVCNTVGGTYVPLYNSSGLVSYTVAAGRFVAIDPKDFQGVAFFKLNCGSAELAARTIICSMKGL